MQPTSLAQVLQIAAKRYGKSVATDRPFLVSKINQVRSAMFKNEAQRENLFRINGCECLQTFTDACGPGCNETFQGITLPVGVEAVTHLEIGNFRIDVTARAMANGGRCGCQKLMAEIEPVDAVLKSPVPIGYLSHIIFQVTSAQDNGLKAGVEYIDLSGQIIREDIVMNTGVVETSHPVRQFTAVTLPDRTGNVRIMTRDAYVLGDYPACIIAPKHRLIHIAGLRRAATVKWWGLKRPLPVIYDTDLVEWSDEVDWLNAFMWLELHFTEGKSAAQSGTYNAASAYVAAGSDAELKATQMSPARNLQPRGVATLARKMNFFSRRWP